MQTGTPRIALITGRNEARLAATGLSHYAASKAALEHMTRRWALEFAADGIRAPARTDRHPGPATGSARHAGQGSADAARRIPARRR